MLRFAAAAALLAGATAAWADTIEEKAVLCSVCHGANGVPDFPAIPIIWGQNEGYLYLELRDFQKGARKDDRMTPIAQSLAKEDLLALAAYFSTKPWPKTGAPSAGHRLAAKYSANASASSLPTACAIGVMRSSLRAPFWKSRN